MNPPYAVILGSGTSNGVPTLGRDYSAEFLANPKNHRTRPSCLLAGPTGNVLIDCSPEMRLQLLREGISDIEATLITHSHADHVMGMDDLRAFCLKYERAMPVYTSPRYQNDIRRIFDYAFREFPPGIWVPRLDLHDVPPNLRLGGMDITTFWVDHGPIPCLGVRVGGFAYLTDVSRIPDGVWPLLLDLDVLVLDGLRRRPHPNHFHLEQALATAEALGPRLTYLTHLSDDYDHDVTEAELPAAIRLAYDGLRIPIVL